MGPDPIWLVSYKERKFDHTERYQGHVHKRKHHVRSYQESSNLQAKEKGYGKKQPCQPFDLGVPVSKTVRNYIFVV